MDIRWSRWKGFERTLEGLAANFARERIRENMETYARGEDATRLDLGNCGMTEVPEEIGECVWMEGEEERDRTEAT